MSRLDPAMRRLLMWVLPIALLAILLGAELNWGRGSQRVPPPQTPQSPAPVSVGLLPDYAIAGGADALVATSAHTLFNPTRHPAPPALASASGGPSTMQRGQFILTGTAVYGDKAVAYLKDAKDGKPRTVRKGETINGMLVAEVSNRGVRFTLGGETEDLPLKVVTGPKSTVQPAVIPTLAGGGGVVPGLQPQLGAQPVTNAANPAQPMSLGERRRAARAAELARERAEAEARVKAGAAADPPQGNAGSEAPSSPLPALPRVPPGQDPRWQQLYQRYQNRLAPPSDSQ